MCTLSKALICTTVSYLQGEWSHLEPPSGVLRPTVDLGPMRKYDSVLSSQMNASFENYSQELASGSGTCLSIQQRSVGFLLFIVNTILNNSSSNHFIHFKSDYSLAEAEVSRHQIS